MRLRRSGPGNKVKQKGPGSVSGTDNVRAYAYMPVASAATERAECELPVTRYYKLIYMYAACDSW